MDIFMIWVEEDGFRWLAESWDSETIAENEQGWEEARQKVADSHPDSWRIVKGHVPIGVLDAAFSPDAGQIA